MQGKSTKIRSDGAPTALASRLLSFGILGGLVGALAMALIALMMPIPGTGGAPFFVAAAMMMGVGSMATVAGWSLHLVTGVMVGAIFGVAVARISALRPKTAARAVGLGAAAGVAVWVVFFMPMMAMLMPALTSTPAMVGGSLVAHAIFGLVLGGVTAVALPKGKAECSVCGKAFATREDLVRHEKIHMPPDASPAAALQPIKCQACGATFKAERELAEHAGEAHPMPAR
jgi:uncharacterized C2H2 Zn-finger protein